MSFQAEEFFSGLSKRYACGREARMESPRSLTAAFMRSSDFKSKSERTLFNDLLKTVESTAEGRRTLREFSKIGCSVHFEDGANAGGFYVPEKKALVINPSSGFKDFSSVFVHEARHAIQFHIFNDDSDLYRFSDGEKLKRAMEADATAHECAFIYQARKTNPEIYEEHSYLPMLHAYADTLERTGNERKAMQASFQSWYSYDYYRDYYDNSTLDRVEALVNYGISNGDALLFSKTMPSDITDRVCLFEGRSYADKKFLMSREAYSIPEDNQKKIGKLIATYAHQVQGASYDNSVYDMYPRRLNGEILDKKPRPRFSDLVSSKLSKSR